MQEYDKKDFLGTGWGFPIGVDAATGRMKTVSAEEDIEQAVRLILMTGRGERMMRPDFGSEARRFTFESMSYTAKTEFQQIIYEALVQWEPRITDIEVEVDEQADQNGCFLVHIHYVVRATNNPYNLVYPYYMTEGLEA